MQLDTLSGSPLDNPGPDDIRDAVARVYAGQLEAAILSHDAMGAHYIQVPEGGGHVEYRAGADTPLYAAEDVPLAVCQALFVDYAQGGTAWRTQVLWLPFDLPGDR